MTRFSVGGSGPPAILRVTTSQRNAMTPYEGQVIWNLTSKKLECWSGSFWRVVTFEPEV
jgi:hypothetical protein